MKRKYWLLPGSHLPGTSYAHNSYIREGGNQSIEVTHQTLPNHLAPSEDEIINLARETGLKTQGKIPTSNAAQ